MTSKAQKATAAQKLRSNKAFQDFCKEVREAQVSIFVTADSTQEQREEAHAIVRALSKIEGRLKAAELDQKISEARSK